MSQGECASQSKVSAIGLLRVVILFTIVAGATASCGTIESGQQRMGRSASSSIVRIGPPETVLSSTERPYAWPDGTMGILRDGAKYRFFAAANGYPKATMGTLDNPIAEGVRNLKIEGLKKPYDYVAGGPIYRDDHTGCLLMFYHAEVYTFPPGYLPFYSELGLARSLDEGKTWVDMGTFLTPHLSQQAPYFQTQRGTWDIGWGGYTIVGDFFYVYFADLLDVAGEHRRVNHAVARARIDDVIRAATERGTVSAWVKYHEGGWSESGLGGRSSPLIAQGDESFLMGDVSYNTYLKKYVAVLIGEPWPNSDLYWIESDNGLRWTHYHKIVDDPGEDIYVTIAGLGEQPRHSGKEFYVYYVHSPDFPKMGNRNKVGNLVRRLITVR